MNLNEIPVVDPLEAPMPVHPEPVDTAGAPAITPPVATATFHPIPHIPSTR